MDTIKFQDLEISEEVKKAIADMGFENATPVQSGSIMSILEGKDLVAQAPTGTGKTCAFGIPMVEEIDPESKQIDGLILCPTRELVIQTTNELMKLTKYKEGVRIVAVYGGQDISRQIRSLKRKPQIIVATPGRLMDHMRRHTIRLENLKYMVLDEADEMLNMGFREDIDEILTSVPEDRQTVLFSATLSDGIKRIASTYLTDPVKVKITKSEITVPNISQFYLEASGTNKTDILARLIDMNDFKLSMVFCNTKRMVDDLSYELQARGYSAEGLHGDMKQQQRDRVMDHFKNGSVEILIATDVAARGIDVDDVEAVFNYDLPVDLEYYVHRIGRTGRANRKGVSYSFVGRREMRHLREIMSYTKAKIKYMDIPKVADIADVRTERTLDEIREVMKLGKHSQYEEAIEKFLEQEEDFAILDVAAAFLSQIVKADELEEIEMPKVFAEKRDDKDKSRKKKDKKERKSERWERARNSGSIRLFVNLGRLDKLRKKQMMELICEKAHVKEKKIARIDVMDKFTFIDISFDSAEKVMNALNGMRYNGRRVSVEVANRNRK